MKKYLPNIQISLLFLLCAIGLMLPYLLQPGTIMWPRSGLGTDLLTYRWPSVAYVQQALEETGRVPLWQTSVMGGLPLIGNPALRIYYPPQLLLSSMSISSMFIVLNTFHFWLAGIGAYGLARHSLNINRLAALIVGLCLMFTARLSSNITGDLSHTHGLLVVPGCLLLLRLALDRESWRWAVLAGVAMAALYLLNLQFTLYTGWIIGLYLLYRLFWKWRTEGRNVWRWLAGQVGLLVLIGLVMIGLSAFQLFPFLTYLPYQSRDAMTLENANHLALPLPLLINSIAPSAQKFPEWELYIGLLPLLLLPLAFRHHQRREVHFWAGVLVFAVLFSLGSQTPIYPLMFQLVPGFRFLRVAPRMWYFVAIAAALLTGLAVDYLMNNRHLPQSWWRWLAGGGLLLALLSIITRFITRRPDEPDWLLGFLAAASVLIALIGLWRWQKGHLSSTRLVGVLAAALLLDLLPVAFAFHAPRPFEEVFETPAFVEKLPRDDLYRLYTTRREIPDHLAVHDRLEVIEGLNSFQFATYSRLARLSTGCELEGIAAAVPPCISNELDPEAYRSAQPDPTLLGMLNVRYIATSVDFSDQPDFTLISETDDIRLYENARVMPRAFAVGRLSIVDNEADLITQLWDLNPRQTVLLQTAEALSFTVPDHDFYQPASIERYEPDYIRLRVALPDDGILVIANPWVLGWQARVNGSDQPVMRVNMALQGVYLPAGDHEVEMLFLPAAFTTGLLITLVTVGLLLVSGFMLAVWAKIPIVPLL